MICMQRCVFKKGRENEYFGILAKMGIWIKWFPAFPEATKVCIKVSSSGGKKNQRSVEARKR